MSRVAVATPTMGAYSETFIQAHIERLPAQVTVLSGGYLPALADGESLLNRWNFYRLLSFRLQQQSRGHDWGQAAKLRKVLARYLQQYHIQAVLAEYGQTGVAMMEPCEEARVPLIVHFHGVDAYKSAVLSEFEQGYHSLFRSAAAIVTVSKAMREQLLALGAPEGSLHLNPYGVDMATFTGSAPQLAEPVFLAAGRFVDKKAPILTLLAFGRTLGEVPDARLVMIGDGPLLDACKQLAEVMNLAQAVEFRGVQSHRAVAQAMHQARCFVQHSIRAGDGDSEGTPVAILEASASGLPVISTRHAGIPDVVVHGETGILVEEKDVEGMAQAMMLLAQNPQLAAQLGRQGRQRIRDHFSMESRIGILWEIIASTIKNTGVK